MSYYQKLFAHWILLTLLMTVLYFSTLQFMVHHWNGDYSYGYLIPFAVLYLIWEKRRELSSAATRETWSGLFFFVIGLSLFWLGELSGEYYTLYLSFYLVLVGILISYFGWEKIRQIQFPILLLPTMFRPPQFINLALTLKLKLISSDLGVRILHLYGMSAYREGNIIDLGFIQLQVVDACSGLRYLFPLLILSLILAYFYKAALWKRAILVISAIPITIITNSLRIALTGILFETWGLRIAEGFFHGFSGWFIFMFGLAVLLFEMWLLRKIFPQKIKPLAHGPKFKDEFNFKSVARINKNLVKSECPADFKPTMRSNYKMLLHPPQFLVAFVLLAATLSMAQGIEFREIIPLNKPLGQFPLNLADWSGKRESMEQVIIDTLDLNDYVIVNYLNGAGRQINFYTAYYESQRKGKSIHSPASCLPGSGWVFEDAGSTEIPISNHESDSMPVNRAYIIKNDIRQLTYFWFPQRGRILTNAYQLKIFNFWDALTRQRTDGALVRVITPVYRNEQLADAEKRLQEFIRIIVPVLDDYLPN